jgi:thiol-disulfide isomerase/thioredoxin
MEIFDLESLAEFNDAQLHNKGVMLVKFGAVWCKPCHAAKPLIEKWADTVNSLANVAMYEVDVDVGLDIYHHFKSKKMVSGIPTILCFVREFVVYPDDSVVGSSEKEINSFFERCLKVSKYL